MILFPNAKVNLGLYITEKRADGFHNLETVFYPIPLRDVLEILPATKQKEEIGFSFSGIDIAGAIDKNTCIKAYKLLKNDFPNLPKVKIHLLKNIPLGAGMGGGSADGAYTLSLLNQKLKLGLSQRKLMEYAAQLGSDCPYFILNKPCIATGRGEVLQTTTLDLSRYYIALIYPKIHVNTGLAFSKIQPKEMTMSLSEIIQSPIEQWRSNLKNDFEEIMFPLYSELKNIKETLYQRGALYASMTGTGSTIYGIFEQNPKDICKDFFGGYFYFSAKLGHPI